MEKEFIPYKLALELKQLGFDEPCFGRYYYKESYPILNPNSGETELVFEFGQYIKQTEITILAPLYQQAFRWFREKYELVHEISWSKYKGGLNFDYDIFSLVLPTDDELGDENDIQPDKSMETYDSLVDKGFRWHESDTYEESEQACLVKLIEIVKEKK
jgi:hypothetical protein